jgi:hypothetical protein
MSLCSIELIELSLLPVGVHDVGVAPRSVHLAMKVRSRRVGRLPRRMFDPRTLFVQLHPV